MTFGSFDSLGVLTNHIHPSSSENLRTSSIELRKSNYIPRFTMARNALAKEQFVKLIVGAGQASPSPPVGPALGSKGVKSMDFCKVIINSHGIPQLSY
jgi:hypothetical protein